MAQTTKRVSRDTWLQTGLTLLAEHGSQSLTIEHLCNRTNRSKGSFYFHFSSIDTYKKNLLKFWEQEHTQSVEAGVQEQADPIAQRLALPALAAALNSPVERAIRQWSHGDETARGAISKVDIRRITFVAQLIAQTNATTLDHAHHLATLEYAAFLGIQQLMPQASESDRLSFYETALHLISPNLHSKKD